MAIPPITESEPLSMVEQNPPPALESDLPSVSKNVRVAVLYGGLSAEREVSLRSGQGCYDALIRLGYTNVVLIDVDRSIAQRLQQEKVEVVFLALHGRFGEDGAIQGVLDFLGIPYTGNNRTVSALTMDKDLTKRVLRDGKLPILPSVTLSSTDVTDSQRFDNLIQHMENTLGYPMMVKPASEGSSIGMAKVTDGQTLRDALVHAASLDTVLLVEPFVVGRSLTVGVFDRAGYPTVTPILELKTKTEWYDYEAKYTDGMTEFLVPAPIDKAVTEALQTITLQAHHCVGCHGVSRVDFILTPDSQFYILEINTIPGMTTLSDLPAQAQAMGVGYDELVDCILQSAVRKPLPTQA